MLAVMHTQSAAEAFGSKVEVNQAELDALVLEYVRAEDLVEGGGTSPTSTSSSGSGARHACMNVKQLLQQGKVQEAVEVVKEAWPAVLEDQRLVFRLKKQQFIEQLRLGSAEADKSALACARNELAPLAMHAYPEAYLDFKRMLLLLVFERGSKHTCPVSKDWSDEARNDLACTVFHTMRQHLGIMDPLLSLLLRYLLHAYSVYRRDTYYGTIQDGELLDALLVAGREAGPLPSEAPPQPFPESVMQSLIHAAGIPRQEALDALKHARGDPVAALKAQLMRMQLNTDAVDGLVWEYACHRGLLSPAEEPCPRVGSVKASAAPAQPQAMDVDQQQSQQQQQQASTRTSPSRSSAKRSQDCVTEHQHAASNGAGVSGSGGNADGCTAYGGYGRSDSLSPPYKVPRWRGRQTAASRWGASEQQQWPSNAAATTDGPVSTDASTSAAAGAHVTANGSTNGSLPTAANGAAHVPLATQPVNSLQQMHAPPSRTTAQAASASAPVPDASTVGLGSLHISEPEEGGFTTARAAMVQAAEAAATAAATAAEARQGSIAPLMQLQALAKQGRFQEIGALVEELQPGLLEQEPALAFELKRCEFMQQVSAGDFGAALALARGQLTPLAERHPALQPQLKAAMGAMLPGKAQGAIAAADSETMVAALQRALQVRMGLPGPKLLRLMQVLLAAHKAWFRAQRCGDTFAAALHIDALRAPAATSTTPRPGEAVAAAGGAAAAAGAGRAHDMPALIAITPTFSDDDDDDGDEEDGNDAVDEDAALRLMEILELPRAAALELLAQYETFEAALHSVFG